MRAVGRNLGLREERGLAEGLRGSVEGHEGELAREVVREEGLVGRVLQEILKRRVGRGLALGFLDHRPQRCRGRGRGGPPSRGHELAQERPLTRHPTARVARHGVEARLGETRHLAGGHVGHEERDALLGGAREREPLRVGREAHVVETGPRGRVDAQLARPRDALQPESLERLLAGAPVRARVDARARQAQLGCRDLGDGGKGLPLEEEEPGAIGTHLYEGPWLRVEDAADGRGRLPIGLLRPQHGAERSRGQRHEPCSSPHAGRLPCGGHASPAPACGSRPRPRERLESARPTGGAPGLSVGGRE